MKKSGYISIIVVLVVLVLALLTNPTADQHRSKIRGAIAERRPIAGSLGVAALTAFASGYTTLGVASYTKVNDKMQSVGALGVVIVFD